MKRNYGISVMAALALSLCACADKGASEVHVSGASPASVVSSAAPEPSSAPADSAPESREPEAASSAASPAGSEVPATESAGSDISAPEAALSSETSADAPTDISDTNGASSDEPEPEPSGTEFPSEYLQYAFQEGALGIIIRTPDQLKALADDTVTNAAPTDPYAQEILIRSLFDNTTVKIYSGELDLDDENIPFIKKDLIDELSLSSGDAARIRCSIPETLPICALVFEADGREGMYVVGFDGSGESDRADYVYPT